MKKHHVSMLVAAISFPLLHAMEPTREAHGPTSDGGRAEQYARWATRQILQAYDTYESRDDTKYPLSVPRGSLEQVLELYTELSRGVDDERARCKVQQVFDEVGPICRTGSLSRDLGLIMIEWMSRLGLPQECRDAINPACLVLAKGVPTLQTYALDVLGDRSKKIRQRKIFRIGGPRGADRVDSVTLEHSLLCVAVRSGDLALLDELIRRGGDPCSKGECGRSLLHEAVGSGYNIVRKLLEAGVRVETDCHGDTPLRRAVESDDCRIAELLLRAQPLTGEVGEEELLDRVKSVAMAKLLLDAGADSNTRHTLPSWVSRRDLIEDRDPRDDKVDDFVKQYQRYRITT